MKDKFRIELKNLPECRSGSEAQEYKGKWPFFDMMQFIKGIMTPNATQGNLETPDAYPMNSDTEDTYTHIDRTSPVSSLAPNNMTTPQNSKAIYAGPSSQPIAHPINSEKSVRKKKRADQSEIDRYIEIEQQKIELLRNDQKKSSELTQNPDYHFLMSLLPYFDEFNGIEKLELRANVQNVVLEALRRKKQDLPITLPITQVYSINVPPINTNGATNNSTVENCQQSSTYVLQSFPE